MQVGISLLSGADAIIPSGVTIGSSDDNAVQGAGSNHYVEVGGTVSGVRGIWLGGDPSVNYANSVLVTEGGAVIGVDYSAVLLYSQSSRLINHGTVSGFYGVTIGGTGPGISTVVNMGVIDGTGYAIGRQNGSTETISITNYGSMIGGSTAIDLSGAGIAQIVNRGLIDGDVDLGAGADLYDGRGGTVEGGVVGAAGDDTFIGNAAWADVFYGGDGRDTLDFRLLGGASVALDGSFETAGSAMGDSYDGFEVILGSRSGADQLRGNGGKNSLLGGGGDDRLDGAAGNDFLSGGNGIDVLTGGNGNDTFIFATRSGLGDTILDFNSIGAGNDDRIQITAAAFGGGLVAGALAANQFQSRADNVAQDADDRFIFRSSDKTLWFDDDGNGAHAALLVANLQASATMTALDIVLV